MVPSMSKSIPANANTSALPVKENSSSSRGMVTRSKIYPGRCSVNRLSESHNLLNLC